MTATAVFDEIYAKISLKMSHTTDYISEYSVYKKTSQNHIQKKQHTLSQDKQTSK